MTESVILGVAMVYFADRGRLLPWAYCAAYAIILALL